MIAGSSAAISLPRLLAELALEHLDDVILAAQLRRVVGDLDPQLRGGRVARRDGLRRLLVAGGGEPLLDVLLEVCVLGVVDELHAHLCAPRERRPVKRDALVDHHIGGVQHRRALLLRDQPVMLGQVLRHQRACRVERRVDRDHVQLERRRREIAELAPVVGLAAEDPMNLLGFLGGKAVDLLRASGGSGSGRGRCARRRASRHASPSQRARRRRRRSARGRRADRSGTSPARRGGSGRCGSACSRCTASDTDTRTRARRRWTARRRTRRGSRLTRARPAHPRTPRAAR